MVVWGMAQCQGRIDQHVLARIMPIQGLLGDTCLPAEQLNPGRMKTIAVKQLQRGGNDMLGYVH